MKPADAQRWRSNRAIGLYLTIVFVALAAYLLLQPWTHRVMRDGFLLGMMPMIGVGLMLLCAIGLMIDPLRRDVPEGLQALHRNDAWLPLVMLLGVAGCFWAMQRLGFLLATPPFLFVCMLWFGLRPARLAALLAMAVPAVVFGFFTALGVRLPAGLLSAWF